MARELNDLSLPLSFSGESLDEFHKWFHKNRENRELLKESVNFKDESNNTILHQLVPVNPPSALVESIIQVAPDTVKVQNNRGYLPLHEACWSKASSDVVAMLIESYPKATEVKDEEGMLPLHLACLKCGSSDVIRILLQEYPKAAEAQDNSGSLPIHYLPCSEGSHNILDMLLCAYPNGTKEQNNDGMLPLHLACIKRANSEVIQILLEAYPKAAEIQDYRGLLPLQYARNNGASPDILKILFDAFQKSLIDNISAYREAELLAICFRVAVGVASISDVNQWLNENNDNPLLLQEAANFKDENNNTPLHRLVAACPPVDLVDRLLQLAPNAIMERDNYNCMPLHVACFNNASLDVVKKLLEAHPKAAEVAEKDGRLPLHIALLKNASFNVMRVLLETYPQSLQKKDKRGRKAAELRDHNGKLLLHHACCNGLSMDLMQMVVEAYTEGCTIKDNLGSQPWQLLKTNGAAARRDEGGMYPLHHACRKKASLHFLKLLLDAYPECIAKVDDYGKTPSQLLEESGVAAQPDENDNDRLLLHSVCSDFSNEESTINLAIFLKLIITAYPKGKNILDRDHMTPLHHACACANSVEALRCLVTILVEDEREPSINAKDKYGRTPLCILMKRTDPTTLDISSRNCSEIVDLIVSSKVVEYLVKRGANIYFADKEKKQETPLSYAENLLCDKYENVHQRLQLYLQLKPEPDAKFYCLLNRLPGNERKEAVSDSYVRGNIKKAVGGKLSTYYLLSDIIKIISAIVFFGVAVSKYNVYLFGDNLQPSCKTSSIFVLVNGVYFLLREIMQGAAFSSSGYFKSWWSDSWNHIDVISIVIMFVWPSIMLSQNINRESSAAVKEAFRTSSTLAAGLLFVLVFSFLKRISINAAVLVRGSIATARKLFSFLLALVTITTAYALMFFTALRGSSDCTSFCSFGSAWFEVYNMILGNYGPDEIFAIDNLTETDKYLLLILYISLGIIAVIVMLNVLIAVVVDSYGDVKNKSSEEVFWSSQLEFVTEVEVTSNWLTLLSGEKIASAWESLLKVYEDKRTNDEKANGNRVGSKFMCYLTLRLAYIVVIVIWLAIGAIFFSLLWPTQVRKWSAEVFDNSCSNAWRAVIKVFEDKRTHTSKGVPFGSKSVYYLIPRVICAFLIIIWLTTGALLCGLIWPPQVREMLWDYFTPQKSSTDEDFWEGIIQDIKGIVKDQEAAKVSEENFSKMVTDMRAEMAKVVDKSDSVAAMINNCNDQIVDMIKQINQLLGKQEDGHH